MKILQWGAMAVAALTFALVAYSGFSHASYEARSNGVLVGIFWLLFAIYWRLVAIDCRLERRERREPGP